MKSIFNKLSALFICGAVAIVGCTDFSADLKDVNKRLEDLASSAATKTEVDALAAELEALIAEIGKQYATKGEVAQVVSAISTVKTYVEASIAKLDATVANKADKAEVQAAIAEVSEALEAAKNDFNAALEEVDEILGDLADEDDAIKASIADVVASVEALQGEVETLSSNLEALEGTVGDLAGTIEELEAALQAQIDQTVTDLEALTQDLSDLNAAFVEYQDEVDAKLEAINDSLEALEDALTDEIEKVKEDKADKAETVAQLTALQTAINGINANLDALADLVASETADRAAADEELKKVVDTAIAALNTSLTAEIKALEDLVNSWEDHDTIYDDTAIKNALTNATAEYKALTADLQSQIDALEDAISSVQGTVDSLKTELRGAILVPDMLFNGTKAVKFHRQDGKNVLKTFATVSYRFNPSNFDASTATYEIVAESVEVMTRGILTEDPAIEIVGKPVQENDKVTFELERGDGSGNMFALKVTLQDGTVIYSDYAAIVDEATFAVATATASFQVERLAFSFPSLTSISAIIDYVQSLGQTIEDFGTTIEAITAAIEAMQNNDITGAITNLIKIPGLHKETKTIYGTGVYKVQVETLDAAEIIEALQNAQTIDEIRKIIADLLAQAEGLGEAGSAIINGLDSVIGNSGLNELFSQYDNLLNIELTDLILTYDKAVATLNGYQTELDNAKAEFQTLQAEMDAIIAGLDAATQAEIATLQAELDALNAQYADLQAQYNAAGTLDKIKIGAQMTTVWAQIEAKELSITSKAGAEYFLVKAELDLKQAGVKTAELLLQGAREAVDLADQAVKNAEETLAKLEAQILEKVKTYILENTELGQYLTDLENALGEQAWEAKKQVAAGTAQLFAIDALIADLIKNYNAANQQVVDEFANSLFGRVAYLIQTQEAAEAFELIGLTDLYVVLKQLPDLLTLIIKYYPAGVDLTNFTSFNDFSSIFSDYLTSLIPETKVEWELDYYLAE